MSETQMFKNKIVGSKNVKYKFIIGCYITIIIQLTKRCIIRTLDGI